MEGEHRCGKKNHLDHEGVRTCWSQPANDLQLAVEREDRICSDGRRFRANLCGFAVAGPAALGPAGGCECLAAHGRAVTRLTCRSSASTTCSQGVRWTKRRHCGSFSIV